MIRFNLMDCSAGDDDSREDDGYGRIHDVPDDGLGGLDCFRRDYSPNYAT